MACPTGMFFVKSRDVIHLSSAQSRCSSFGSIFRRSYCPISVDPAMWWLERRNTVPFGSWWPIVMRRCCVSRPAPCTNALCQRTCKSTVATPGGSMWTSSTVYGFLWAGATNGMTALRAAIEFTCFNSSCVVMFAYPVWFRGTKSEDWLAMNVDIGFFPW